MTEYRSISFVFRPCHYKLANPGYYLPNDFFVNLVMSKSFFVYPSPATPFTSICHYTMLLLCTQTIMHTGPLSITFVENISKSWKLSGSYVFWLRDGQVWGSVSDHNVQVLYRETSQLPSPTTPVICLTANQALKQPPLLSCPTCGVQSRAKSFLYTLWCGIM